MAQLGPQFPGLGGHPSLSLHSTVDGAPVLCEEPGVLSKVGAAAVAGVIALLPELLALAAPYPNSYRRFGPGNWAPATATWGLDNYSCALRVVADDPESRPPRAAHPRRRREPAPLCRPCSSGPPSGASRSASSLRRPCRRPTTAAPTPVLSRCPGTSSRRRSASRDQRGRPGPLRPRLRRALRRGPPGRGCRLPSLRLRRRARPLPGPGLNGRQPPNAKGAGRWRQRAFEFELSDEQVDTFARDGFVVVEQIIDPALARRALERYEDLFAGHFETGLYPDEWNWRAGVEPARPDPPDLQRLEIRPRHRPRRAATRRRAGLRPAGRVAGRPPQPGQRAVEAAGRQAARVPPGLELRAVGRAGRMGQLLDRPRGHHGRPGHGRVRARLAPLDPALGDDRRVPRARRPPSRAAPGRGRRRCRARTGPGRGPRRRRCVPRRLDLARLAPQHLVARRDARWWPTACRRRPASTPRRRGTSTAATSGSATTPWTSRSSRSPGARTATARPSSTPTSRNGSAGAVHPSAESVAEAPLVS